MPNQDNKPQRNAHKKSFSLFLKKQNLKQFNYLKHNKRHNPIVSSTPFS